MGICHQLHYLAPQRDAVKETNQSGGKAMVIPVSTKFLNRLETNMTK